MNGKSDPNQGLPGGTSYDRFAPHLGRSLSVLDALKAAVPRDRIGGPGSRRNGPSSSGSERLFLILLSGFDRRAIMEQRIFNLRHGGLTL